ncbi:MAG: hypothetical protein K2X98_05910 [Alphaproteobacteria bacterium]|nr:hypothetical protein [Alphaproteobacteria bacterium]
MTGFYVGVGAVTGATTARYTDAANSVPAAPADAGPSVRNDSGKTNFGGRIEAGYGMTFAGCGWFGVSVYTTALNTKMTLNDVTSSPSNALKSTRAVLKNSWNYGLEFKLGYHFTKDTVGFVGIAAEAGKYKLEWTQSTVSATGVFAPTLRASKTKIYAKPVIGVRTTGLGGNRNLFLEAKYGYGFSNRVTLNVAQNANGLITTAGTNGRKVSARPRTHEFSVTLGWRF